VTAVKLSVFNAAAVLAFAAPCWSFENASEPPVPELVSRSVAANTADWRAQPEYSHRERDFKNKVDANGRVQAGESKTYERFMLEGSPYSRLVEIDGKPLSREQEQQEQIKLNAETARRAHESANERRARVAKYEGERAEEHLLMQQMAEAFEFSLAGEQRVNGVDCYVLDARPNPAYRPPVEKARVLLGMKGRLWIDKQHYHWVKVQAEVINAVPFGLFVAKVKPGTRFELEQAPSGNVWLPRRFSESVNATIFGVYGMRSNEEELYSDYRAGQGTNAPSLSEIALR
jgi:hypothetical protein